METMLDAIKKYADLFSGTAQHRSMTTPSEVNRKNHKELKKAIDTQDWDTVESIINDPQYRKALFGVVCCLNHFEIDVEEHTKIIDIYGSMA